MRPSRWQRIKTASVLGFHAYANWLVGISWKRFALLALLLLVFAGVLKDLPPFSWTYTRTINVPADVVDEPPPPPEPPAPPAKPAKPAVRIDKPASGTKGNGVEIVIDERGVRISPRAPAGASAASAPAVAASGTPLVEIKLPPGATSEVVREAVEEARHAIEQAVEEARIEAEVAREEARQVGVEAAREARRAVAEARKARRTVETHEVSLGEFLPSLAFLWIVASLVIKITYRKQIQAEAQAAQAVETAEAESLRRQVVEARMAAMQAQVEPHFLFNTLASIDHLIEVDPKRASQMQKNLIALLRASMPTMREAGGNGGGSTPRDRSPGPCRPRPPAACRARSAPSPRAARPPAWAPGHA
jgi:hypothetical protein